ncbi:hypothetical protein B566_EDAN005326 [Ephemera danica]|nr:hypothetical protein B566_EDAN005326 [Ephemera danica]
MKERRRRMMDFLEVVGNEDGCSQSRLGLCFLVYMMRLLGVPLLCVAVLQIAQVGSGLFLDEMMDARYWRCVYKRSFTCPNPDIRFYLYAKAGARRKAIDVRMSHTALLRSGFDPDKRSVILLHGFNGTVDTEPLTFIKRAYLNRGDYNVVLVDWGDLTKFPCYLTALSNTKLVAQCAAQMYSYLNAHGAARESLQCVGHSLGAHICGMMTNHLTKKQHRIIDDASHVQVIHTNAGFLGAEAPMGHVDFCVNGGRQQPSCTKTFNPLRPLRNERCSHFQGTCFFATTVTQTERYVGVPCARQCPPRRSPIKRRPGKPIPMGEHTPLGARGTYCVTIKDDFNCPFFAT